MPELAYNPANLPGKESILRQSFENGATLLAYPNLNSPAVYFRGYLPAGSISDPQDKEGLANFNAAMLSTGTRKHDFQELHYQIESCGASLSVSSGSLSTLFGGQCLKEDLPLIFDLLLEMLSMPTYPQKHFERIKQQLLTIIRIQAQDTEEMSSQAFDRLYYRDHPYAIPDIGYADSLGRISLEDLSNFHQQYFGPRGLVMAISGGISPENASQLFDETFSTWQAPSQSAQKELPEFTPPDQGCYEHIAIPGKSQSDLIIGTQAPAPMTAAYQNCVLGNSILGQFGMMGRIGEVVREQNGLAYYAGSTLETGLGPTCWKVYAGVNPDNLQKAIQKIKEELRRFISEPVTTEELADVKSQALGRLPLSFETNAGVVSYLLSLQRYQLDLDHLKTLPELLANITADDILKSAQSYWDLDKLIIASAGRKP